MNIINTPVIDFHSHVGRTGNYNIIDDMDITLLIAAIMNQ